MTDKEKQEIEEVVGRYGKIRREYWEKITEIRNNQAERKIHLHTGELQIMELDRQQKESDERMEYAEMAKEFDNKDDDFKKHFHSVGLREFNDMVPPEDL